MGGIQRLTKQYVHLFGISSMPLDAQSQSLQPTLLSPVVLSNVWHETNSCKKPFQIH